MPTTLFITAALLLCGREGATGTSLAAAVGDQSRYEVVGASPVPAQYGIGSHFGYRTSTRTHQRTFHAGLDFLVPRNTPVFAAHDGVVEQVVANVRRNQFSGYGNAIVIRHPDTGHWSFYAHLSSADVEEGQIVRAGQPIGRVGNTTNGRFPGMVAHLHFEVRQARSDGRSPFPGAYRQHNVDPEEWLAALGVSFDEPAECPSPDAPRLALRAVAPQNAELALAERR